MNIRGDIIAKRTYCRPLDADISIREDWNQVTNRVISHSEKLWRDAGGVPDQSELDALREVIAGRREGSVAGRTLWLGGTEYAYSRACSQFNCAFSIIDNVSDLKDLFWLLLNGCGTGFNPRNMGEMPIKSLTKVVGKLSFHLVPNSPDFRGNPNTEIAVIEGQELLVTIGDSAEGWVEAIECLLLLPYRTDIDQLDKIHFDFNQCRGAGQAIKGYGWICSGPQPLRKAMEYIVSCLSKINTQLPTEYEDRATPIQVLDIMNLLGEVLSTRRSAQIALLEHDNPYIKEFINAKSQYNLNKYPWRVQSNNSVLYMTEPTYEELMLIKEEVRKSRIEPGIVNGFAAKIKAPWFAGVNPCVEILLANKGFCNLVEVNLAAFYQNGVFDLQRAEEVVWLLARHNYRQTCVDLRDGILQDEWHDTNQELHLCGVSLTGFGIYEPTEYELARLRRMATTATYSMAIQLGLPLPGNVTTVKPSGTISKVFGTSEGIHTPIGRYIFNWVVFPTKDPLVPLLIDANYSYQQHPTDPNSILICLPEQFDSPKLTVSEAGHEYDDESIGVQFQRYLKIQEYWSDQNVSNTMYYRDNELDIMFELIYDNWDKFIAFSFMPRQEVGMSSEEIKEQLNASYLPQELVDEKTFNDYVSVLSPVDVFAVNDAEYDTTDGGCINGACPVR